MRVFGWREALLFVFRVSLLALFRWPYGGASPDFNFHSHSKVIYLARLDLIT